MDDDLRVLLAELKSKKRGDLKDRLDLILSNLGEHIDELLAVLLDFECSVSLSILQRLLSEDRLSLPQVPLFVQVIDHAIEKSSSTQLKAVQLLSQSFTSHGAAFISGPILQHAISILTVVDESAVLVQAAESGYRLLLTLLLRAPSVGAAFLKDVALDVDLGMAEALRVELWSQAVSTAEETFWREAQLQDVITQTVVPLALEEEDARRVRLLTGLIEKAEVLGIQDAVRRLVIPALLSRRTHLDILENTLCRDCVQFIDRSFLESLKLLIGDERLLGSVSNLLLACLAAVVKENARLNVLWASFLDCLLVAFNAAGVACNATVVLAVLRGLDALFAACLVLEEGAQATADSIAQLVRNAPLTHPVRKTFLNVLHRGLAVAECSSGRSAWSVWLDTVQLIDDDAATEDETILKVAVDTLFTAAPSELAAQNLLDALMLIPGSSAQVLSAWRLEKVVLLLESALGSKLAFQPNNLLWPPGATHLITKILNARPGVDATNVLLAVDSRGFDPEQLLDVLLVASGVHSLPTSAKEVAIQLAMKSLGDAAALKVAEAVIETSSAAEPTPDHLFDLLFRVAESGALNLALRAVSLARKACDSPVSLTVQANKVEAFFQRVCLMPGKNSQTHQIRDCAINTMFSVVSRSELTIVGRFFCTSTAKAVLEHVPDEQESVDTRASDLIVHHSRDSAEKQWEVSRLAVVTNLASFDLDDVAQLLALALLAWQRGGVSVRRAVAKFVAAVPDHEAVMAWLAESVDHLTESPELLFLELVRGEKASFSRSAAVIALGRRSVADFQGDLKSLELVSDSDVCFIVSPVLSGASTEKTHAVSELCCLSLDGLSAALDLFLFKENASVAGLARVLTSCPLRFPDAQQERQVTEALVRLIETPTGSHSIRVLAFQALIILLESARDPTGLLPVVKPAVDALLAQSDANLILLRVAFVRLLAKSGFDVAEYLAYPSALIVEACLDVRLKTDAVAEPVVAWVKRKHFATEEDGQMPDHSDDVSAGECPDALLISIERLEDDAQKLEVLASSFERCKDMTEGRNLAVSILPHLLTQVKDGRLRRALKSAVDLLAKN